MAILCVGIAVADFVSAGLPRIAAPGEIIFTPKGNKLYVGGHACNVSIDLVQLGADPTEVHIIFPIGKDILGNFLEKELKKRGIRTYALKTSFKTSSNLILVVKGEDRRFHVDVGTCLYIDPDYALDILVKLRPSIFYVGATGLLGDLDDRLPGICHKARELGSITFASMVAPFDKNWFFIKPIIKHIDIFHCNSHEAYNITGIRDPVDSAEALSKLGAKVSIVTAGARGVYVWVDGGVLQFPPFKVDSVDPTGAGDALCAGIIHKLTTAPIRSILEKHQKISILSKDEWSEILTYASACGAACSIATGTTTTVIPGVVEKILREQGEEFRSGIKIGTS